MVEPMSMSDDELLTFNGPSTSRYASTPDNRTPLQAGHKECPNNAQHQELEPKREGALLKRTKRYRRPKVAHPKKQKKKNDMGLIRRRRKRKAKKSRLESDDEALRKRLSELWL